MKLRINVKLLIFIIFNFIIFFSSYAVEYHVSVKGNDKNIGTENKPLKTIQAAANIAQPGDIITVHKGVYRERIDPPRGGTSDSNRIVYRAKSGDNVIIKGSEQIKGWEHQDGDVWLCQLSNNYFGSFNPFANEIRSDWFFPLENQQGVDKKHLTGTVYINNQIIEQAETLEELYGKCWGPRWFAKSDNSGTYIWTNFKGQNPNKELVEINKRRTVFYPSKTGINFITVKGFHLTQAANPWSPPTREQVGLIGVNWSKGWIIENNRITHARCAGLTLGKYHDRLDGLIEFGYNAHYQTVERVIARGDWTKENIGHHIVRNNHISDCEQAGMVGSHGASFSLISGNKIHDINVKGWWDGFEQAGIKFHAAVDTILENNLIYNCQRGIWLDWMSQGARVTGNILYNNEKHDFYTEVNHGPLLADNNIFLSDISVTDVSQGGAFVHNLFGGKVLVRTHQGADRSTQYFKPHSCIYLGESNILDGDDRFYNNIFMHSRGLKEYDKDNEFPVYMSGNLFLKDAQPLKKYENKPQYDKKADIRYSISKDKNDYYLNINLNSDWSKGQDREIISTSMLGKTKITNQAFDDPNGNPIFIDTDYFGKKRNQENPNPGPFLLEKSITKIKVWPKE